MEDFKLFDHVHVSSILLQDQEFNNIESERQKIAYFLQKKPLKDCQREAQEYLKGLQNKSKKQEKAAKYYINKGVQQIKQNTFDDALCSFSKAIVFAPYGSKLFTTAYEKRSYVHSILNNDQQAINDCEIALEYEREIETIYRIKKRKLMCLMNSQQYSKAKHLSLDIIYLCQKHKLNCGLLDYVYDLYETLYDLEKRYHIDNYHSDSNTNDTGGSNDLTNDTGGSNDLTNDTGGSNDLTNDTGGSNDLTYDYECVMNENLQYQYDEERGRYLIATDDIENDLDVIKETAFICVLFERYFYENCTYCCKSVLNTFLPCEFCCDVVYCNSTCRAKAWRYFHDKECKIAKFVSNLGPNAYVAFRSLILNGPERSVILNGPERSVSIKYNKEKNDDTRIGRLYHVFESLLEHRAQQLPSMYMTTLVKAIYMTLTLQYLNLIPCDEHTFTLGCLGLVHSQFKCIINTFGIFKQHPLNNDRLHIGNALVLGCTFINHSCDPNLWWKLDANTMTMRTIRKIKKGQEVNITYGPYKTQDFNQRQQRLKTTYHFECKCPSCIKDSKSSPPLNDQSSMNEH